MKCRHCKSEWSTSAELGSKLSSCPFCGKELIEAATPNVEASSIEDVLTQIIRQHGLDVLKNGNRMISFYMDMAPVPLRKEKTILEYLVQCKGNQQLLEVKDQPLSEKQIRYEQVVYNMCNDLYISEGAARKVCDAFCRAVYGESVEQPKQPKQAEQPKQPEQDQPREPAELDVHCPLLLTQKEAAEGCTKLISIQDGQTNVSVKVPKGIENGKILRLNRCGREDPKTGRRGDAYLKVQIIADKTAPNSNSQEEKKKQSKAAPQNLDVGSTLYLSKKEAEEGLEKEISVSGIEPVVLRIMPGIKNGTVLCLKGSGRKDPATGAVGNLNVTVKVTDPQADKAADTKISGHIFYVSAEEARVGKEISLAGAPGMKLVIPAGTKDEQRVNVRGNGKVFLARVKICDARHRLKPKTPWGEMPDSLLQEYSKRKGMGGGSAFFLFLLIFLFSTGVGTAIPFLGFAGWFGSFYILYWASRSRKNHAAANAEFERRRILERQHFS